MSQPAEFPPLPETTGNVGEVSGGTVAPFCDAMRWEERTREPYQDFSDLAYPNCRNWILLVRQQNTTSQEASQGAKSKQGIVAQPLSGWQSTVFCILYEYMHIYVWDVNKVHLSTIAEAWVGFTCHYD